MNKKYIEDLQLKRAQLLEQMHRVMGGIEVLDKLIKEHQEKETKK
tara:strand:+ start:62 stop:196 length:135 start_codon:yes stop_codon:yes gene_type:complete